MKPLLFIMMTSVGLSQFPTYELDKSIERELHVLNVTYITPAMHEVDPSDHLEHMLLLKLNTLMLEAGDGRHPEHRCKKIVDLAKSYIEMTKSRNDKIKQMNRNMEVYLGTRKTD